jgi:hypothetical protein
VLIQSESAYIYHFEGSRFVDKLGAAKMAFIGNSRDRTVSYQTAAASWQAAFRSNVVSTDIQTEGALPAHASPGWNPNVYRPILQRLLDEFFPLPKGGSRVSVF